MKITKQRLKEIIKEELEFVGAAIDDVPEPPEEEPTRDRAFDSPEGRLVTLINAREALGKMTRDELKDLSMSLDADMVATLRHILANPMYAPTGASDRLPQIGSDPRDQSPLEEGATEYSELLRQGYSQATALAMASGSPAKKAEYDKLRKQGHGDSEARRFVYGRSYSAMGQR